MIRCTRTPLVQLPRGLLFPIDTIAMVERA
jgi:hypothetical protein